uniref:Uncharacterized protein n=1 Tax=Ditylenchus dipsaci TaxID=166011 RepID=A0A915D659_9BILA
MLSNEQNSSVPQGKAKISRGKVTNLRKGVKTDALRIKNVNDYIEPSIGCIKSSPGTHIYQEQHKKRKKSYKFQKQIK